MGAPRREVLNHDRPPGAVTRGLTRGLKWGPAGILVFWLVVMGLLYAVMKQTLKPAPMVVLAAGELVITRARDGHFYAPGLVNGKPVRFLIDTGASMVTVSEAFARSAGISKGVATVFKTANGDLPGRVVAGVTVSLGPLTIEGSRIGVGLVGHAVDDALLGQSFLASFEMVISKEQMILRRK